MPEYDLEDIWNRTKQFVDLKELKKQKTISGWQKQFNKSIQDKTPKRQYGTAKNLDKIPGWKEKAFIYQSGYSRQRPNQKIAVISKKKGTRVFAEKNILVSIKERKRGEGMSKAIYFYNIKLKKRLTWGFVE